MAVEAGAVLALLSGIPLLLLGGALLLLRPRRPAQVFFGSFAALWGLQVITANAGYVLGLSATLYEAALRVDYALQLPTALFLVHVVTSLTGRAKVLPWLYVVLGTAGLVVLLLDPAAFVTVGSDGSVNDIRYGWALIPLAVLPFFSALYLSLALVYVTYRGRPPGSPRHRLRILLIALALYPSYATASNLFAFLLQPGSLAVTGDAGAFIALFLAGSALLGGITLHLVLRPPPPEGADGGVVAAFLAPAAVALAEAALHPAGVTIETTGLWRVLTVAVLVYAVARHQLFDLDLRLKRAAGPALAAVLVVVGLVVSLIMSINGVGSLTLLPVLGAVVAAGGALAARRPLGELLFPDAREEDAAYAARRKLEVYEAALEEAARDPGPSTEARLADLRRTLGITDREHDAMRFVVARRAGATPSSGPVRPGAVVLARYRIDRLLGEGAHGRAFLAHDEEADGLVVVKAVGTSVLGGRAASLLLREARVMQTIDHPNVVRVLDVDETDDEALLVLEHVDGGNLFGLLKRRGALGVHEATRILDDTLAGLEAAHAKGVVHRDVKPENLLLTRDGGVKVADFGVAQADDAASGLTAGAVGTLLYMSPEQVRGGAVDHRSDLYAAAVVFHLALTGRFYLPIAGKDDFQLRRLILEGGPRLDQPEVTPALAAFLTRALAKDPAARFPSAGSMRDALGASKAS